MMATSTLAIFAVPSVTSRVSISVVTKWKSAVRPLLHRGGVDLARSTMVLNVTSVAIVIRLKSSTMSVASLLLALNIRMLKSSVAMVFLSLPVGKAKNAANMVQVNTSAFGTVRTAWALDPTTAGGQKPIGPFTWGVGNNLN